MACSSWSQGGCCCSCLPLGSTGGVKREGQILLQPDPFCLVLGRFCSWNTLTETPTSSSLVSSGSYAMKGWGNSPGGPPKQEEVKRKEPPSGLCTQKQQKLGAATRSSRTGPRAQVCASHLSYSGASIMPSGRREEVLQQLPAAAGGVPAFLDTSQHPATTLPSGLLDPAPQPWAPHTLCHPPKPA